MTFFNKIGQERSTQQSSEASAKRTPRTLFSRAREAPLNGWLHAGGSHDVHSGATPAAHLQDEYPTATVPAAHRSGLDRGTHTRSLARRTPRSQVSTVPEMIRNSGCGSNAQSRRLRRYSWGLRTRSLRNRCCCSNANCPCVALSLIPRRSGPIFLRSNAYPRASASTKTILRYAFMAASGDGCARNRASCG